MTLSILLLALTASNPFGDSDSWPGWRGQNGDGVASGSPPIEWSEEENVRWKVPLPGKGLSSPVVWEGFVFVTTSVGTGKMGEPAPAEAGTGGERGRPGGEEGGRRRGGDGERGGERGGRERGGGGRGGGALEEQDFVVFALDRKTGAIRWEKKLSTAMPHQGTHRDGSFASPTPVTDGERLYVSFGSYGIHALDMAGEVLWSVDLGDMDINNGFGEGSSPILCDDRLIVNWDHEGESFLVALDKKTGKETWRAERPSGTSWTTPVLVSIGGARQIVVAGTATVAYDPASGAELWRQGEEGGRGGGPITSPMVLDELVILTNGGRGGGEARAIVALEPGSEEKTAPLLWKQGADAPHVPSPLLYDGKIYMLKGDSGMLSVMDPSSGEVEYGPERLDGVADVYASLLVAGGNLYVIGRDGTIEVVAVSPEIATLAVNRLEDQFDASPAVAGDELFLRGRSNVYCVAE